MLSTPTACTPPQKSTQPSDLFSKSIDPPNDATPPVYIVFDNQFGNIESVHSNALDAQHTADKKNELSNFHYNGRYYYKVFQFPVIGPPLLPKVILNLFNLLNHEEFISFFMLCRQLSSHLSACNDVFRHTCICKEQLKLPDTASISTSDSPVKIYIVFDNKSGNIDSLFSNAIDAQHAADESNKISNSLHNGRYCYKVSPYILSK